MAGRAAGGSVHRTAATRAVVRHTWARLADLHDGLTTVSREPAYLAPTNLTLAMCSGPNIRIALPCHARCQPAVLDSIGARKYCSLHGRVVKGVGHLGHDEAMEAGGREFEPRPGHYSRMSF